MRPAGLLLLLITSLTSLNCAGTLRSQPPPPQKWETGFWYWDRGYSKSVPASYTPDVLFFLAGTVHEEPGFMNRPNEWRVSGGGIPKNLPHAREYWPVYRFEHQGVPPMKVATEVASRVSDLLLDARDRNMKITGVQLDIDSPTRSLPEYAAFLQFFRKERPKGLQISITALLDWFRDGTSIGAVIRETDEFVPQFYDIADPGSSEEAAIAAKLDTARWGPVFNRFGKRFRIGLSAFGRVRLIPPKSPSQNGGYSGLSRSYLAFNDLVPLDIGGNPAVDLQTARTEAGEIVLNYRVSRSLKIGWNSLSAGDTVQFVLPVPEQLRATEVSAHRIGGYCAGVVFFRWPQDHEVLALSPDEILATKPGDPTVKAVDGQCAAVTCSDIFITNGISRNPMRLRYRFEASGELEYFIPEPKMSA